MKTIQTLKENNGLETKEWKKYDKERLYCDFHGKTRGYIDITNKKVVVLTKTYTDEMEVIGKEILG